jgi:hypothetical protein
MLPKEVLKVKGKKKGGGKWWSIGRRRKDSKEEEGEEGEKTTNSSLAATVRAKCRFYIIMLLHLKIYLTFLCCSSRANANNNGTSSSRSIPSLQKYVPICFAH